MLLTFCCSEDADVYLFLIFCRSQLPAFKMEKNGHVHIQQKSLSRKIHIMWACASGAALEGTPGDFSPLHLQMLDATGGRKSRLVLPGAVERVAAGSVYSKQGRMQRLPPTPTAHVDTTRCSFVRYLHCRRQAESPVISRRTGSQRNLYGQSKGDHLQQYMHFRSCAASLVELGQKPSWTTTFASTSTA